MITHEAVMRKVDEVQYRGEAALIDARLTPGCYMILELLVRNVKRRLTTTSIAGYLYENDPNGGPLHANESVSARVSQLQEKIEPYGLYIDCVPSRWFEAGGYQLKLYFDKP